MHVEKTFYTYLYLRYDGTPYYVGKGSGNRAFSSQHRVKPPTNTTRIMIQEFPSEQDAFEAEKFLIAYYGRIDQGTGCLRNLTDGGENPPRNMGYRQALRDFQARKHGLIGKVFGRLTVIQRVGSTTVGGAIWLCKCTCGNSCDVFAASLRNGHSKSCGCLHREKTSKGNTIDRRGQRFGRLVVVEQAGRTLSGEVRWLCKCDCGGTTTPSGTALRRQESKSCGCLHSEVSAKIAANIPFERRRGRAKVKELCQQQIQ